MSITVLCRGDVDSHRLFPVVLRDGTVENAFDLICEINGVFGHVLMVPVFICPSVIHVEKTPKTGLLAPVFYKSLERYLIDSSWINSYRLAMSVAFAEYRLAQVRAGEKLCERTRVNGAWSRIPITEDMQAESLAQANDAWSKHLATIREQTDVICGYCDLDVDAVFAEFAADLDKARARKAEEVARNAMKPCRSGIRRRKVEST